MDRRSETKMPLIGRPSINKREAATPAVDVAQPAPAASPFAAPPEGPTDPHRPAVPLNAVPGARYLQASSPEAPRTSSAVVDPEFAADATLELRQRLHRSLIREIDQSALNEMGAVEARALVERPCASSSTARSPRRCRAAGAPAARAHRRRARLWSAGATAPRPRHLRNHGQRCEAGLRRAEWPPAP